MSLPDLDDAFHGGPATTDELEDQRHKAESWDRLCQVIFEEFSDIIRGEWNTGEPGGAIGCVRGALRDRADLLAEHNPEAAP